MKARLEVVEFEPIHVTLRDGCSANRTTTGAAGSLYRLCGPSVQLVILDLAYGDDGG